MFSGIIKHTGKINKIYKKNNNCIVEIISKIKFSKSEIGSSISCSGTCLTLEKFKGNLLSPDDAIDMLMPPIQGVDLTGLWASGIIYTGVANSKGQKHWFETESFSLDYSLITADEKMVKATFAGSEWNQSDYETFMAASIKKLEFMIMPSSV